MLYGFNFQEPQTQFLKWESCLQSGEVIRCLPFLRFLILRKPYLTAFSVSSLVSKDRNISTLIS